MITLSLNFDGITGKTERASHEKKVREIVGAHFAFPGSDKLKMCVSIKDNGSSSVTFAGPKDIVTEAKRLWQENVKPTADRAKSVAGKASTSFKKSKTSAVPKGKKVRVTVKASASKKTSSKKNKK